MPDMDLRASFDRCESAGDFSETFYNLFLASSPEIAPYFEKTDFTKQKKLLRATVYILVTRPSEDPEGKETLERIGRSHAQAELNVKPALYELWLDSLCKTVAQLDPEWSSKLEGLWRQRMRPGIETITSLY